MTNPMDNWEEEFRKRSTWFTDCDEDKCFFPYAGDNHDFSTDNCVAFIKALLEAERERASQIVKGYQNAANEFIFDEIVDKILNPPE